MQSLLFANVRGTMLLVHGRSMADDQDWDALARTADELGTRMRRCLVFADVALTPQQRRQIADACKRARTQIVVVITDSSVVRLMVTGVGWFTGIHKAFSLRQLDVAVAALAIPQQDVRDLLQSAHGFATELGLDSLARQIARHPSMSSARPAARGA